MLLDISSKPFLMEMFILQFFPPLRPILSPINLQHILAMGWPWLLNISIGYKTNPHWSTSSLDWHYFTPTLAIMSAFTDQNGLLIMVKMLSVHFSGVISKYSSIFTFLLWESKLTHFKASAIIYSLMFTLTSSRMCSVQAQCSQRVVLCLLHSLNTLHG